jgi:hypothetical protein
MAIIHITGATKTGKTNLANALRNDHIGKSTPYQAEIKADKKNGIEAQPERLAVAYGALLVDDTCDGEDRYLIEKLMAGGHLGEKPGVGDAIVTPVDQIVWKQEPLIIFVNEMIDKLAAFEALVPGFTAKFGPVRTLPLA